MNARTFLHPPSLVLLSLLAAACGSSEGEPAGAASTGAPAAEPPPAPAATEAQPTEREAQEPAAALTATIGQPAPDFELRDQDGETRRLADYRGRVVVLEWINPECPYVQRHYQAGTMKGLDEAFPDDRVVWLAIDSSHFVTPESSRAWREQHGLPYPILQDPSGATGRAYGATTTPNMFVIDAEGVLRYRGAIDDDPRGQSESPRNYVREAVEAVLAGRDVPTAETRPYGCTVKYENS